MRSAKTERPGDTVTDPDLTGIAIDTTRPVLVTGATGYVAGWIVKGLLLFQQSDFEGSVSAYREAARLAPGESM